LELLFHKGAHTTQGIKEKILIASSSTTYVIDQLVKKGLVQRRNNPRDRRVIYVEITKSGIGLMEKIFPLHAKRIADSFEEVSLDELHLLQKILKKISKKRNEE
jgi:MarR family 2-MHQ and catechol resistance regulon transcriptional repressor